MRKLATIMTVGCASAIVPAIPAHAQLLEEVVVTAQKRDQGMQDVGIAITAFTGEQMDALGFEDSSEIVHMTPGVHVGASFGGQTQQFTVRGVTQNDFSDHTESPVAAYIDDTYILSAQGQRFATFDLDRVEVLKGPQGTLFGRNATGGLIHFVTRKPTEEFDGFARFEVGSYETRKLEAAVGGAIADGVRARIAGLYSANDSFLRNFYDPNAPQSFLAAPELVAAGSGQDLGQQSTKALRAHLDIDLSDNATLLLSANWADAEMSSAPYQSEPTYGVFDFQGNQVNAVRVPTDQTALHFLTDGSPFNVPASRPVAGGDLTGYRDRDGLGWDYTESDFAFDNLNYVDVRGLTAKLDWDLGGMTLVSVTDYKSIDKYIGMDIDSGPMNQLAFYAQAETEQWTQEIRLLGETESSRWVAGFYYMKGEYDNAGGFKVFTNGPLLLPPGTFVGDYPAEVDQTVENYSIFGQIDYDLTPNLTLTAGLRVIQEEKEYDYALVYRTPTESPKEWATGMVIGDFGSLAGLGFPTTFSDDVSDTLWTGKVQLDWRPTEDLLLYAGVNRGVKAGGFNAPIDFGGGQLTPGFSYEYDEEVLLSYETGFKSTLFGGTTRFNGSLYYYDYQDYQAYFFAGVSGVVINADSSIMGGELELTTSPIPGLDIMLGLALVDAEVEDVAVATGFVKDVEPSFTPELMYNGLVRYGWDAFNGELALQTTFNYSDDFYYSLRNFDSTRLDSYFLANVRASFTTADGAWEWAAFVKNVTDEKYAMTGFDISAFCGCSEVAAGEPRWWGMSLRKSF